MRSLLLAVVIFNTLGPVTPSAVPLVSIDAGTLEGGQCTGVSDAVYFKSIPYAQPPTGDLRFAPPQPHNGKFPEGSLLATSSAPACIQFGTLFAETGVTSEDCLYLDIWAPSNATQGSALPVKAWIYGGAETAGGISDALYDGCNVAKDNAILVLINYRIGPLGFLALGSAGIQGNQAIQDILLGLDWIQSNIAAFGGDPKKVLLFGQSAGAINTYIIATLPQAPNLINAAISESGGGRDVQLNTTVQSLAASYATSLGCGLGDIACLRSKSVSELKATFTNLPALQSGIGNDGDVGITIAQTSKFYPHLDGEIIPTQPSEEGVRVPTIFGSNAQEGTVFALGEFNGPAVTTENYTTFLQDNFGQAAGLVQEHYPLSAFNSSPYPAFFAIATMFGDASYKCTAYRGLNRAVEKNIPVWTYLFDHNPSCLWLPSVPQDALSLIGATHTAEIPYVFGNLVNLPAPNGTCNSTQGEDAISAFMIKAWTSMAANGDPSNGNFSWPAYGGASNSLGINFVNSTTAGLVNYTVCELWDQVSQMLSSSTGNGTNSSGAGNSTGTASTGGASGVVINVGTWVIGVAIGVSLLL